MKENKYDDQQFFNKYSGMSRSTEGLEGAGEWHALQPLLPDFSGRRVLDLGCGFGWHCRYAAQHGASYVLGVDLSANMLARAKEMTDAPVVEYRQCAIEDVDVPAGSFDVVLSSLAMHYVRDWAQVVARVYDCLAPGGSFVFSCEHPVFTAQGPQDWCRDESGALRHWPVDRYFDEGERQARFLGEAVTKYHRTLTTYLDTLMTAGFSIRRVVEPQPDPEMLDVPGMADELRRPMMLIVVAEK